ncbi:patatin-like phospholipase family protein [Roseicyclus sp. F158]|uniref:Patatin-like phospholipase family protein n=1 Tax=Tropicimonas omnivorans TaxID=3075590 RepID=A0ABU3DCB4_9RHOB|nr:patatin-like phospholipase family protein [Roseicyclus sp. F158]MDT0681193.1 patatin-like phospholipase family protein [Roseicyclus sp. F158]
MSVDTLPSRPDQIVFSGGGLRCFWQGGFMSVLGRERRVAPSRVCGVSGGALSAAVFLGGRESDLLDRMCEAFARQDRNVDLFDRKSGRITPHQEIYCRVVKDVLDPEAEARVAAGPSLQILIAHPPLDAAPALGGVAMSAAYEAELHVKGSPHFGWAEKMGLTSELVDANEAARQGKLADLVCAAAVIPPVFIPPDWNGRPTIDGGMADQAPMPDPDEGTTLVLLTREYPNVPDAPGRHYVVPRGETPADKIDFTDGDKLMETWNQGERDAEHYLAEVDRQSGATA